MFLENYLTVDVLSPAENRGQTQPITFWPDIYSDSMGAVPQMDSFNSCLNDNQAQFRIVSENMNDQGFVISYPV